MKEYSEGTVMKEYSEGTVMKEYSEARRVSVLGSGENSTYGAQSQFPFYGKEGHDISVGIKKGFSLYLKWWIIGIFRNDL
ncbi:hypothetical protein CDAR_193271 [Caerostris darwini]|uniref:Uncharacterized protein n=1 Tax=Caerostris darwini TaxID=1538125 RepID=A0AAV4QW39_9ARAC|nr:hypothetical protein CDAR_193271 [Caerostris darwini]